MQTQAMNWINLGKSISLGLGVTAFSFALAPEANAASFTDTVVIIDESGSMGGEQAWIPNAITQLENELQTAGLGTGTDSNRYGLVGFGRSGSGVLGRSINVGGNNFGNAQEFDIATNNLVTSGGFEDGYSAIDFTLSQYNFRPGAAVNFILVTDEDRDNGNGALTFQTVRDSLTTDNILLNAVVNNPFSTSNGQSALGIDFQKNAYVADGNGGFTSSSNGTIGNGFGSTETDYVDLALDTGGAAWDLNFLRAGGSNADSFTNAFVDIKVQEIKNQPPSEAIPEPLTILGTLTAGGIGATLRRKLKRQ